MTASLPSMLDVAGHSIAYRVAGSGAGAAVCIHGFGSDRSVWSFNVPALAATTRVYTLDLPAHGQSSPRLETGSLGELVGVVAGFITALGLSNVQLVGHSLGGAIAIRLAAEHPRLAAALTLVAPAGIGVAGTADLDITFARDFLAMRTPAEAMAVLGRLVARPGQISPTMAADVLEHARASAVHASLSALVDNALQRDLPGGQLRATLEQLAVPIEILWGTDDAITPAAAANGLPASIPVHRVSGAGHLVQMEKSVAVNRVLVAQAAAIRSG
jgi:pyruvate dehydrogenase E2 component (dihydrolipoamide acetyltransferase)